jgi:pimeloyl-ACP methyl ester carboxylesterase
MTTWVLVRGLTREAAHWGPFPRRLAQAGPGTSVVAVDLPGAGALHDTAAPTAVAVMAHDCRGRLLRLGVRPPYRLLGLSLGGMVALEWTAAWPGEVSHCVLVNTSMRPHGRPWQRLRPSMWLALATLLARRDPAAVERRVLRWTSSDAERHAGVLDEWIAIRRGRPVSRRNALRQLWAAARYRAPPLLPAVPGLVLCSARDRLVDPACSRALAAQAAWPLAVHPHAGHDLPLDDPGWIVAVIREQWGT